MRAILMSRHQPGSMLPGIAAGDTEVRRVASSRLGRRWAPPLRSNRGDRVLEGSSGYGGVIGRPVARGNRGGDALLLVGQRGEIALLQLGASRHGAEIG